MGALSVAALALVAISCSEKLPLGPTGFSVSMAIKNLPDTIVIGDTKVAAAEVKDAAGAVIQKLQFTWTLSDTSVLGLGTADTDSGRTRTIIPKRGGVSGVTLTLPDSRFVVAPISKQVRAVVAAIAITSTKDTTLTAVNDTLTLRATGFAKSGTTTVARANTGLTWTLLTSGATTLTATGDSARLIALGNGTDTLIVRHTSCLAGARCADTAFVRVNQALKLTLTSPALTAWSFGDTVFSAATLKDRRGNGQVGTVLRFVPRTAADSAIVLTTALTGFNTPSNGTMSVSRFVTRGNGTANVIVRAFNAANVLQDTAAMTVKVRQIATRASVLPLTASVTDGDSIPLKPAAIDARGNAIGDATIALTANGVTLTSTTWALGAAPIASNIGTVFSAVSGVALASNNVGAPSVTLAVDTAQITSIPLITAVAGSDSAKQTIGVFAQTYGGAVLGTTWVVFKSNGGTLAPDSVLTGVSGNASVLFTPSTASGRRTMTAVLRRGGAAPVTAADSAGLILARRTVRILGGAATAVNSTVTANDTVLVSGATTTVIITGLDSFGNPAGSLAASDFVTSVAQGTLGAFTCIANRCSATYTAPAASVGTDQISATIGGTAITGSPVSIRRQAGAVSEVASTFGLAAGAYVQNTDFLATVTLKDANGNTVLTGAASDFVATATAGAFGTWTCTNGVCTTNWHSPSATTPAVTLSVKVNGTDILTSPKVVAVP
jgi:hypothetical protein